MKTSLAYVSVFLLFACAPEKPDELAGNEQISPSSGEASSPANDDYQGSKNQAHGYYTRGSLYYPNELPAEGFGFVKIARPRNFGFGTYDLVEILKETAAALQRKFPSRDRVMVGDLSRDRGGNLPGHVSHQNGLDADVAFIRLDQTEQDAEDIGGFAEHFVKDGALTPNFDLERNWHYAKLLAGTKRVERIFVGEMIKKGFCAYAARRGELESERETLLRLRVISGHTDHFHVRVGCPKNSPSCKSQVEIPDETGC
jgi:penicillin-insensitive murein DD-endopeptidase